MRAIFLDRDGVLNEDLGYVHRPEDLVVLPGVPEALTELKNRGFLLIVITNQSGVARGYFDLTAVERFHKALQEAIQKAGGAPLDDFYICPHHPEGVVAAFSKPCSCRKPQIGMLLQAQKRHAIDLPASYFVGDKLSDIDCALGAGVRGIQIVNQGETFHPKAFKAATSLQDALKYLL